MASEEIKKLKRRAITLATNPALNFYDLAVSLTELHHADQKIVATLLPSLGMSRRRLYYLIEVGSLIIAWSLGKKESEAVGWTKLQIITRHLIAAESTNHDEMIKFLALAKSTRSRDLRRSLDGKQPKNSKTEVFHLTQKERDNLRSALVAFGAKSTPTGLRNKDKALMQLVAAAVNAKFA